MDGHPWNFGSEGRGFESFPGCQFSHSEWAGTAPRPFDLPTIPTTVPIIGYEVPVSAVCIAFAASFRASGNGAMHTRAKAIPAGTE
jgi:hypothetical protein